MRNCLVIVRMNISPAPWCAGHEFVSTPNLDALANARFIPTPIRRPPYVFRHGGVQAAGTSTRQVTGTTPPLYRISAKLGPQPQDAGVPSSPSASFIIAIRRMTPVLTGSTSDDDGSDGVGMIGASIRHEEERLIGRVACLAILSGGATAATPTMMPRHRAGDRWLRPPRTPRGWCLYVKFVAPHFPLVCQRHSMISMTA